MLEDCSENGSGCKKKDGDRKSEREWLTYKGGKSVNVCHNASYFLYKCVIFFLSICIFPHKGELLILFFSAIAVRLS